MANESTRLLQVGALVIPVILAAAGGKWAVDATRLKTLPATTLPTPEELDSLRGYVVRTAPVVQAPAPSPQAYAIGGSDPFAKVARWETPKYIAGAISAPSRPNAPRWIVSTIMITENRRFAVINGVQASVGSVLSGGARVLTIEPDHVVIAESDGARREVSVQSGAN